MQRHSRRGFLRQAGVGAALHHSVAGTARPNIMLVLSDDHSVPHVGCYGNPDIRTPNLDRLAREGMRFDRAYATCPQCVPARASIMTGRSPVRIQMTRFTAPLPAEVRTYPELLRAHGYFTGVAGRTHHMDSDTSGANTVQMIERHKLRTFAKRLDYVKVSRDREQALAQCAEFLDLAPKDRPFSLQLSFHDPHRPHDARAIPQPHDPNKLTLPAHYPDTRLIREDFARYYDEIGRLDGDFGRAVDMLAQRGVAQNTLVAFMGDNGAALLRGKGTLYEFGIHVPLILRWPGHIRAGSVSSELISGEDLAPTFLEAAGIPPLAEMTGRSFLKLLHGGPFEPRRYVFAERGAGIAGLPDRSSVFDLSRCIVSRTHKLIYNALWQIPYDPVGFRTDAFWEELQQMNKQGKLSAEFSRMYFSPSRAMFELYDLANDPHEFHNLAGRAEFAALERELKTALHEWMLLERDYLPLPLGN